ncbi:MAG: TonB-dependent receptor, partial [Flavobacteriaceae bacterium]|nr:TonB-dependent receptor [Flavobacteriaceae bacterium]
KQNLQLLDLNTNAGIQSLRSLLDKNADKHELQARDLTRKDFRFKVGPSMLQEVKTFYNLSIPLNPQSELYAFGGISYRQGTSSGFYRIPAQKNGNANTALFPNGFLPELESKIYDIATTVGVKTNWKKWQLDISNTYGKNMFDLRLNKSSNSTLKNNSPTAFTLGGFRFSQNTTNVDLQNYFNLLDRQFSIALGAEFKIENYNILSGEATSYTTYDNNALAVTNTTIATDLVLHNFYGTPLLGGAQMYRGFEPKNAIDKNRNNLALYADIEADMMPNWTLNIATRFERFSDFGSTFIYKLAMRYAINEIFSIRSAINTGFRAPSLHQQFFRKTNTIFLENKAFEAAIFPNHSKEAALFKIPRLNEELSQNVSGGITMKQNNFFFTLDAYHIAIADRIVLSGAFSHGDSPELQDIFAQEGATSARFLVNAVDTKSIGLELVASH